MPASTKWIHRARVVEAMVLIVAGTLVRRAVPMPKWSRILGESTSVADVFGDPALASLGAAHTSPVERGVAMALRAAGRRLPYNPRCLDRVTAGQLMLRRRRVPGIAVIGLSRTQPLAGAWGAHAWLVGESGMITGGAEAATFTAASCFVPPSVTERLASESFV